MEVYKEDPDREMLVKYVEAPDGEGEEEPFQELLDRVSDKAVVEEALEVEEEGEEVLTGAVAEELHTEDAVEVEVRL